MPNGYTKAVDLTPVITDLTDIKGAGFATGSHDLRKIATYALENKGSILAVKVTTDALSPLLPASGELDIKDYGKTLHYQISDDLLHSNDPEVTETGQAYVKKKEIICPFDATYRITFDVHRSGAGCQVFAKIYKNGVAHGAEQTSTSDTYETKTEDLAFVEGDTIELWMYINNISFTAYAENFRIKGILYSRFYNTIE